MQRRHFLTRESNLIILFGLFGVGIGWLSQNAVEAATSGKKLWLALAPLVVPVLLLMAVRPVFGAVAVVGFAFVNTSLLPSLLELGPLTVRYVDGVFGLLIGILLARMAIRRRAGISREFRQLFGPLVWFFLYIGLSLMMVRVSAPDFFAASVAAYMRLVLTALFAVVLHEALRDRWDMQLFHKALIVFAMATVVVGSGLAWAGVGASEAEALAGRTRGVIGLGGFGLVAGLLVLYAFIKKDDRSCRAAEWLTSLSLGLFGLFLAKSAVSIFATAGAVTVYFVAMRSRQSSVPALLRLAAIGTIMTFAAVLAVWTFRQSDLSGVADFSGGSFTERLMFGYAGLRIFLDNPLIGVGWQASTAEAIAGAAPLTAALMEKFHQLPANYFLKPPTSVHNMYIQFLAELGIIGFALFVWICCRMGKSVAGIVKKVPAGSPYRVWAQFDSLAIIFLLIWWNGNPLFGGQTESILAVTFLALLVNVAQLEKQRTEALETARY